jgi:hypothetical protein
MAARGAAAPSSWTLLLRSASGWSLGIRSSPLQLDTFVLFAPLMPNQRWLSCAVFAGAYQLPRSLT